MATTIKLKNSVTTTNAPTSLVQGEVAINVTDKKVWVGNAATTPIQLLGDGGSGSFTTVNTTNLEVTNIKAKDGTASASIANSTGVMTVASSVLTTTDINGGTIDGATVGATTASTGAFSTLSATGVTTVQAGTVSAPAITTTGDTNTGIFFPAADTIAFAEGGAEAMRIDSSGNVGIGTTSPTALLDVFGGNSEARLTTSLYGFLQLGQFANGGYVGTSSSDATAGVLRLGTAGTERMRIDSSGNVGIGITNPNTELHVQGAPTTDGSIVFNEQLTATTAFNASPQSGTMVSLKYNTGGDYAGLGGWSVIKENATDGNFAGAMLFHSRANGGAITERMRINSSGNLLVGTLNGVSSVGRVQSLQADQSNAGLSVDATNASFDYKVVYLNTTRAASTAFDFIQATTGGYGTVQFRVRGDGNVYNTNGVYSTVSDIKLKENIADATSKLEKLNQVRVVNYNLKDSELKQIGFIAQELEQVFPSLVEDNIDKDVSGNDLGTVTKSVKLTVFIPILVKAIQEQQAIINDLTTRLTALENK
jgi:hypothetical protein